MTIDSIPQQRLANQHLTGNGLEYSADVVAWLGAVQSQDFHGAKWAVAQRMTRATDADLDTAYNAGDIVRTHVLRPTWHFVAPADIRWMLDLTAPRVHQLNASMYRQTELDDLILPPAHGVIEELLGNGQFLTRKEIGPELARAGIEANGLRLAYIMMHAELEGLVCSGPLKGKQHTYTLITDWAPSAKRLTREEALATLVHRYFQSHGPATVRDFSWWSGLTAADAKTGIAMVSNELESTVVNEEMLWSGEWTGLAPPQRPLVHLLPNYDEYFAGNRTGTLDAGSQEILAAGRLDGHHIVVDGQLRGGWRRRLTDTSARIELDRFDAFSDAEEEALAEAIGRYSAFLGKQIEIGA